MDARGVVALVSLFCLLPGLASGSWREAMPDARWLARARCGYSAFIYDARLEPDDAAAGPTPFCAGADLSPLHQSRRLRAHQPDEMKRLSGPDPDASVPARWREHTQQAFVDVRPGERITGVYLPERGCRFYVNERLHHEVTDPQFAEAFFAIWFDLRSRDPGLRRSLLGER